MWTSLLMLFVRLYLREKLGGRVGRMAMTGQKSRVDTLTAEARV